MSGGVIESAHSYAIQLRESANDGSDFANGETDYRVVFLGEDGQLHAKDSAGTVTDLGGAGGSVATDAIWDAAGDIVQGTGANTAARLALGAAGTVVRSTGSTNAYAFPPGHEFDYVEKTSATSITATSEATANTVVTGGAVTYDGSTVVIIEFYSPSVENPNAADGGILLVLYDGSSSIGFLSQQNTSVADSTNRWPLLARRRLTPSAAAHTYSVRAFVSSGTGSVFGGAGGAAAYMPAFIRQTKV